MGYNLLMNGVYIGIITLFCFGSKFGLVLRGLSSKIEVV